MHARTVLTCCALPRPSPHSSAVACVWCVAQSLGRIRVSIVPPSAGFSGSSGTRRRCGGALWLLQGPVWQKVFGPAVQNQSNPRGGGGGGQQAPIRWRA